MVGVLAEEASRNDVELRMSSDPAVVTEDSLALYRGFVLLNTSADELTHRAQADLRRFIEAGGGFLFIGAKPARTWPWLDSIAAGPEGPVEAAENVYLIRSGTQPEDWQDQGFLERLREGFALAAGGEPRYGRIESERVPDASRFEQQILVEGTLNEPTELAVASDGRVFFTERQGALKLYDPATGSDRVIHQFDVFTEEENGLIGITLDPNFDSNGWIYITRTVGDTLDARHRVARFTFDGQAIGDERVLLEVPIDRGCCHTGGSMTFDGHGNLLVSFGDNSNPFATSYAPLDDRPGRELWDARRTSANTQDLRGKIIRIRPQPDGTYTIPEGNLFTDPEQGRPEIYTMGHRNPYRISYDPVRDYLFWGDVGPDARADSTTGPMGYDEVNRAREAGNFGWPLFIADNKAYHDRDFATGTVGEPFDPARPINDSRNNTGARVLPPAQPAMIYYPYERSEEFPRVGEGGRTAMAGPLYRTAPFGDSDVRLPDYYDGKFIHYDWIRGWMMATTLDENGDYVSMEPFLEHLTFDHPMDLEVGPDGSLYLLEYGPLWFAPNPAARLSRIVYHRDNRPPRAVISASPAEGAAPLEVTLSAEGSADPDEDDRLEYRWLFADGSSLTGQSITRTFEQAGEHVVQLVVSDGSGAADTAATTVTVGNDPPVLTIDLEGNRSFFWNAATRNYHVSVRDTEDGTLGEGADPTRLRVALEFQPGIPLAAEPVGHQTEQTPAGLAYIQQSDCSGCHGINEASVGPSFRRVAERYAGADTAAERLVRKIIEGGSGVWGDQVMPAHPDMSEDVAAEIVRYIFSLVAPGETLPTEGMLTLNRHQPGETGAYVLTATYVDGGASGAPPLEARQQVVLHAPVIRATDVADRWGMLAPADSANAAEGSPLAVVADGAYLHLGALDLTGVAQLVVTLEEVSGEITLELRAGAPDGERIATGSVTAPSMAAPVEAPLTLAAEGEHDLYLVVRTQDPLVGPWSPAARIRSLRFDQRGTGGAAGTEAE